MMKSHGLNMRSSSPIHGDKWKYFFVYQLINENICSIYFNCVIYTLRKMLCYTFEGHGIIYSPSSIFTEIYINDDLRITL